MCECDCACVVVAYTCCASCRWLCYRSFGLFDVRTSGMLVSFAAVACCCIF